jgi:acetyl-CoA decarbonylase/synthase complex subunit beta
MADSTAGGRQVDGFHGVSIEYLRSPKFIQADGGWNRVVWMPSNIKERVKDFIPAEVVDMVATEKDVEDIDGLKEFLKDKGHPIVGTWKAKEVEEIISEGAEAPVTAQPQLTSIPIGTIPMSVGGFRIILKDAKIVAKKLIIRSGTGE